MSHNEAVFSTAHRLQQAGTAYALVSVIKALAPASARPGDKAIVTADGQFHGWVGGGCAQPAVIRTVRQALLDGRARMIRITPSTEGAERDLGELLDDVLEFGMACHSGGTLELFVDPVLPRAQLVVIGHSPVALSLTQLAPRVGFQVTLVAHQVDAAAYPEAQQVIAVDEVAPVLARVAAGAWVVVATQGRRDVQALRLALALGARQVSFVASARKAQVLKTSLIAGGADAAAVDAIIAPAGLAVAATTPEEIALSVLAAVVAHRRGAVASPAAAAIGRGGAAGEAAGPAARALTSAAAAPLTALPALAAGASPAGSCCGGPAAKSPLPEALALPVVKSSCCGS